MPDYFWPISICQNVIYNKSYKTYNCHQNGIDSQYITLDKEKHVDQPKFDDHIRDIDEGHLPEPLESGEQTLVWDIYQAETEYDDRDLVYEHRVPFLAGLDVEVIVDKSAKMATVDGVPVDLKEAVEGGK